MLDGLSAVVLTSTAAAVVLVGQDGTVAAVNPAAAALLRAGESGLVGRPAAAVLVRPREAGQLRAALRRVAGSGVGQVLETGLPGREAEQRSVAWSLAALPGPERRLVMVGVDVSTTRAQLEDLQARAFTDELTGLANRARLVRTLAERAGTGATVLFCDLNGFKQINDTHGHAAGDEVLVEVARRLVRAVRGEDLVGRLGGDEFVVVAPAAAAADPDGLRRRVLGALRQPMLLSGGLMVLVGAAVGVARLAPGRDPLSVLRQADQAMYDAKPTRTSRAALVDAGH